MRFFLVHNLCNNMHTPISRERKPYWQQGRCHARHNGPAPVLKLLCAQPGQASASSLRLQEGMRLPCLRGLQRRLLNCRAYSHACCNEGTPLMQQPFNVQRAPNLHLEQFLALTLHVGKRPTATLFSLGDWVISFHTKLMLI